jgi:hypothetical protein
MRESEILSKPPVGIPLLPVKGIDAKIRAQTNNQLVSDRAAIRLANDPNRIAAQLIREELKAEEFIGSEVSQNKIKVDDMETDDISEVKGDKQNARESENEGPTDNIR